MLAVSPEEARGASYLPASNVLRLPDGRLRYLPPGAAEAVTVPPDDPGAAEAAASRAWLAAGTVPGGARRARHLRARSSTCACSRVRTARPWLVCTPRWRSVWPRDASFVAVAFAATGHHEESYQVLSFLAAAQEPDGTWEARYDAAGTPVLDGRTQLDAGLVPLGYVVLVRYRGARRKERAGALWPATRRGRRGGGLGRRSAARRRGLLGGRDLEAEPRHGRSPENRPARRRGPGAQARPRV